MENLEKPLRISGLRSEILNCIKAGVLTTTKWLIFGMQEYCRRVSACRAERDRTIRLRFCECSHSNLTMHYNAKSIVQLIALLIDNIFCYCYHIIYYHAFIQVRFPLRLYDFGTDRKSCFLCQNMTVSIWCNVGWFLYNWAGVKLITQL